MTRSAARVVLLLTFIMSAAGCATGGGQGSAPPDPAPSPGIDVLMQPGVSLELARHRAQTISAVRYRLALDVTRPDTAFGSVTIAFTRWGDSDLVLDFRGLSLDAAMVNGSAMPVDVEAIRGEGVQSVQFNGAHVRVPAALLRRGDNEISLRFASAIAPAGASIIRVRDQSDGSDYLYTLLVPADANQLFPCFDQPDLKARLTLSLTVPHGWTAVSNASVALVDSAPSGSVVSFTETEPISTYLMAFAAGPWKTFTGGTEDHRVTLYVRASRSSEVQADSLIDINLRALRWLAEYFGRPYPFPKLDLVLAPAFPFGGMEHPGAIFYNEERLIFRERPTLERVLARSGLIYHEVAHQWFGNLVTMRWFDDLWLKEGFATYMAALMREELDPGTGAWKNFHLSNKPAAYAVDVTQGTTPVWQELANLDQAKSNYGPIVYNKAPSVLRQLDYMVGDRAFREGVRAFLDAHAYGNATWRDLLAAIGDASGRSLDGWGREYILRAGMPVIEQQVEIRDGRISHLVLTQRPARDEFGDGAWPLRTQVAIRLPDGELRLIPVEFAGASVDVEQAVGLPAPDFVFANAGDFGYAVVLPDSGSAAWLVRNMSDVTDDLFRALLWSALWDLVRAGQLDPAEFVHTAVEHLAGESDEQIAGAVLSRVRRALHSYMTHEVRQAVLPGVEAHLRSVADNATAGYGLRKQHLDALIDVAGTGETLLWLDRLLDADSIVGEPSRPPTRWAIVAALLSHAAPGAFARFEDETQRDSTSEGRRRAFIAGAAVPSAETKRRYFSSYLNDAELNEEWAMSSLASFNHPLHRELTLGYVRPALDTLHWIQRNRRIFFLGRWLSSFVGDHVSREALARVDDLLDSNPSLSVDLRRKVLQERDELERAVRIREKWREAGVM